MVLGVAVGVAARVAARVAVGAAVRVAGGVAVRVVLRVAVRVAVSVRARLLCKRQYHSPPLSPLSPPAVEGPGASRLVREYQMNDQLQLQRRVARAEAEAEVLRRQMEQLHEWAAATGARSQAEIRRLRAVVGR